MNKKDEDYIKRKKNDIEGYIAVAVGSASMIALMEGKCTDAVINARDEMTKLTLKTVDQIIKRLNKKVSE